MQQKTSFFCSIMFKKFKKWISKLFGTVRESEKLGSRATVTIRRYCFLSYFNIKKCKVLNLFVNPKKCQSISLTLFSIAYFGVGTQFLCFFLLLICR